MNKTVKKRRISRILSALFMLLFLILSSIAIVGVTYADKAHIPDHVLNYDTNRLFWEEGTSDIYEDGTYRLNLFDSLPIGNDGMKIIAPGANDGGSMRLINRTSHKIEYTAAIFLINSDGVPITADFTNFDSLNRVVNYTPSLDIGNAKILRAVEGELDGYGAEDFYVSWEWEFSRGDEEDLFDTELGNLEISEITLGVYITVNDSLEPSTPSTENGYVNVDTDGDYILDTNIDTDNDGEAEINVDIDGDYVADINIDTGIDYIPDINIDINGDLSPDFNFDNDYNGSPDNNILPFEIINSVLKLDSEASEMVFSAISGVASVIKIDNFGVPISGIELSVAELREFAKSGRELTLVYEGAVVFIDNEALRDIADSAKGSSVVITVEKMLKNDFNEKQIAAFENNYVAIGLEFSVKSGSVLLNDKIEGGVEISIPYTLNKNTTKDDYVRYSIDKAGNLTDSGFEYIGDRVVFSLGADAECVLLYTHGELDDGTVTPEPPSCACLFCLFGGNCIMCWLCWLILILAVLLAIILIIGLLLLIIYGL